MAVMTHKVVARVPPPLLVFDGQDVGVGQRRPAHEVLEDIGCTKQQQTAVVAAGTSVGLRVHRLQAEQGR